jgi:hypothetical protein
MLPLRRYLAGKHRPVNNKVGTRDDRFKSEYRTVTCQGRRFAVGFSVNLCDVF